MSARTLADWLEFIGRQHPDAIALGLDRVRAVMARMDIALACPVFTVGGTNGKGSVIAFLEGILRASGRRVGLYASPHLLRYNERVQEYNTGRRQFPGIITAKIFSFKDYPLFEAPASAQQVPKVGF